MKKLPLSLVLLFTALGLKAQTPIDHEQRLSSWLKANPTSQDSNLLGLMWETPEELARQHAQYAELQQEPTLSSGLKSTLLALKPTGRVPQPTANAYWLEAYPRKDPLLKVGDRIELAQSTQSLRVLREDGGVCDIPHRLGALAEDYIRACRPDMDAPWSWVVQPDGRIQRVGLKAWNTSVQNEPAPGAWIWAPNSASHVSDTWSWQLANWLRVQGPSTRLAPQTFFSFEQGPAPQVEPASLLDWSGRRLTPAPTYNDWGEVGLIQTPSARMAEAGYFGLTVHNTWPYHWLNFMFQPLDWLETGFRYTNINNRLYSPNDPNWSNSQSDLDKSFDVKARILRESDWLPELAVGMRDIAGTGLFSSEYVVANKRTGRLDWSLGMAWGNMGGRGNIRNPFSQLFGQQFNTRVVDTGQGGNFSTRSWFRGNTALFGGVTYQTPWNVLVKVEYDGNNYKNEPLGNAFTQTSPFNWSLVYSPTRGVDLSAGIERGNTWSVGVTLYTDLASLQVPKVTAPRTPPVTLERPLNSPDWSQTASDIEHLTLWDVKQIYTTDHKLTLDAQNSFNPYPQDRLDKAMAVIHRDAPARIEEVEIRHQNGSDVLAVETVQRSDWVTAQTQPARVQGATQLAPISYAVNTTELKHPELPSKSSHFIAEPGLDFVQTTGGPDGYLYQFQGTLKLGLELPWNLKASSTFAARLADNYQNFVNEGSSSLPRVRTFAKEFLTTSRYTVADLTLSKTNRLSENWYWTGYTGYFETMFGGWGSEVLYRQPGANWGVGTDYNQVRMRDFHQNLQFQTYRTTTGHVTGYWETPFDGIDTSLSVGQYLAGDKGFTWTISKVFNNGVKLSGYFTRTNVPAAVFGEGSFDKGIAVQIPFDALLTSPSRYSGGWSWKPLVRDGGAILNRPVNLFSETSWLSPSARDHKMAPASNDNLAPDDQIEPYDRKR